MGVREQVLVTVNWFNSPRGCAGRISTEYSAATRRLESTNFSLKLSITSDVAGVVW